MERPTDVIFYFKKLAWKKPMSKKATKITRGLKPCIRPARIYVLRLYYSAKAKEVGYRKYVRSGLYQDPRNDSPFRKVKTKLPPHVVELRTGHSVLKS